MLQSIDGEVVENDGGRAEANLSSLEERFVELEDDRRGRRRPVLFDELGVLVGGFDGAHARVKPEHLMKMNNSSQVG